MKRFIWLMSNIPMMIVLAITGGIDFYIFSNLWDKGLLEKTIWNNTVILKITLIVLLIATAICAVYGGKIGYKYVEMARSRQWHYRANKYDDYDGKLHNIIHWAVKMACVPSVILLLIFSTWALYNFV